MRLINFGKMSKILIPNIIIVISKASGTSDIK